MTKSENEHLPPGRQPCDTMNGARIGALAGGIVGALATTLVSFSNIRLTLIGAVVGAAVGYYSEKGKLDRYG